MHLLPTLPPNASRSESSGGLHAASRAPSALVNRPRRARVQLGITIVELLIGVFLGLVVMLSAGSIYLGTTKSFKTGSQKLLAQREATQLSSGISRRVRVGSSYRIYVVPNRTTPADSGDGLAILSSTGALLSRLEWNSSLQTLVDSTGNRVTSMRLRNVKFKKDPAQAKTLRFRFQTDDQKGNFVDIETATSLRN